MLRAGVAKFLPRREGHVGGPQSPVRRRAVIYRYRTGIPWCDLPERYGHWKAVHRRYRRWCESGIFVRVFEIMSRDADNEFVMLDATIVRAYQHSAGAQKNDGGAQAIGRSRGGLTTKIHAAVDNP